MAPTTNHDTAGQATQTGKSIITEYHQKHDPEEQPQETQITGALKKYAIPPKKTHRKTDAQKQRIRNQDVERRRKVQMGRMKKMKAMRQKRRFRFGNITYQMKNGR